MNTLTELIYQRVQTLPSGAAYEVLNFINFVEFKQQNLMSSSDHNTVIDESFGNIQPPGNPLEKLAGIAQGTGESIGREHNRYLYGKLVVMQFG